jgi:hypothetical protein
MSILKLWYLYLPSVASGTAKGWAEETSLLDPKYLLFVRTLS